ncbi:MAG: hypothetical protein R2770_18505 [Acidimicrobiales bacterium]|nr:hypothetical protein [Acidimicrobiales bacterium]
MTTANNTVLNVWCCISATLATGRHRVRDEAGEGVISAAIAVLIVAALGALMWVGFQSIWADAEATTRSKIAEIGG